MAEDVAIADLAANQLVTFEHFGLQMDTTLPPAEPNCRTEGPTTSAEG